MTLLSSLQSPSTSGSPIPSDFSAPPAGRGQGRSVRAVEYVPAIRDPLRQKARQAGTRQPEDEPGLGLRDQGGQGGRAVTPRPEAQATPRPAVSVPFLVQVLGQDLGRSQAFVTEHRDATVLGSEAYRRAGATPPIYSEQPTIFRIAV